MTPTPGSNALTVQPGANAMAANHGNTAYLNSQAVALKQQQYIQRQQLIAEQVVTPHRPFIWGIGISPCVDVRFPAGEAASAGPAAAETPDSTSATVPGPAHQSEPVLTDACQPVHRWERRTFPLCPPLDPNQHQV